MKRYIKSSTQSITSREIKELTLVDGPEESDYSNGLIYDSIIFQDAEGNKYYFRGVSSTVSGNVSKRHPLVTWGWSHMPGDTVKVKSTFSNNGSELIIMTRPVIEED